MGTVIKEKCCWREIMNVCTIVYSFYETDTRVRMYAEALAQRGDNVDAIALKGGCLPDHEIINGVHVYRIQERIRNEKGKFSYLARLLRFLVGSAAFVSKKHLAERYDLIHVHSVPDFEVFAALIPKLTGAKVILDIHDIVPEFYASKFNVNRQSAIYIALKLLEKISVGFSDHVIIANHIWEKTLVARSACAEKCTTFLNYPNRSVFRFTPGALNGKRLLVLYPGSLNWHQGLDIAIKAFAIASKKLPDARFDIYGEGPAKGALKRLIEDLDLQEKVRLNGFLPLEQIVKKMAEATIAVVPKRNDSFGGEAFSTKVFEFMALGVPVILSKTKIDQYYFNDSVVQFFEPENYRELADALASLALDENRRQTLANNALKFIDGLSWQNKKFDYYSLVDKLLGKSSPHAYAGRA